MYDIGIGLQRDNDEKKREKKFEKKKEELRKRKDTNCQDRKQNEEEKHTATSRLDSLYPFQHCTFYEDYVCMINYSLIRTDCCIVVYDYKNLPSREKEKEIHHSKYLPTTYDRGKDREILRRILTYTTYYFNNYHKYVSR